MPITLGNTNISGLAAGGLPNGSVTAETLSTTALSSIKVIRRNTEIRSNIQSTSGTFTDDISGQLTSRTFAVILYIGYIHAGGANHGYWAANFFQQGFNNTESIGRFDHQHFNWYYNVYDKEIIIPWSSAGSNNLQVEITSGLFTGDNKYFYGIRGVMER